MALLEYADRITVDAASSSRTQIGHLREQGLSDDEILQAAAIAGCTNYMNRIALTLGVELESPAKK